MTALPPKPFPFVSLRVLSTFLIVFYIAWCIRVVLLMPIEDGIGSFWIWQLVSQSVRIALWGLPCIRHAGVRASRFRCTRPETRCRAAWTCAAQHNRAVRSLVSDYDAIRDPSRERTLTFAVDHTAAEWATIAVTMIWAPIFEEILFRGYVFQALRGHMAWLGAAVISGALFAAGHWPGWIYLQGLHSGLVMQTVSITILGIVLAAVFEHGQSLWPCIILHTLNNLLWA